MNLYDKYGIERSQIDIMRRLGMLRYNAERDLQMYEFYCCVVSSGTPKQEAKEQTADKFNLSFSTVNNRLQQFKRG